jgi:hypothetical protein
MTSNSQPFEIPPPWDKYPGFAPADPFWRQSGEAWFKDVWEPFYNCLSEVDQREYLERWKVPELWRMFYFDKAFQQWLDTVDDDES